MIELIRSYVFDLKGEAFRGLIITVLGAAIFAAHSQDLATVTDWPGWGSGIALAGANAGIAFVFGRIPPSKPVT